MKPSPDDFAPRSGCLLMLLACAAACLMFVANGIVFSAIYTQLAPRGPEWLRHAKVAQVLMFVTPLLMLIAEWWVLDQLRDRLGR